MSSVLDMRDIQGDVVRAYCRYGYPHARYFLFHVHDFWSGRDFIRSLLPHVTTSEDWRTADKETHDGIVRPKVALNIALSWRGLTSLNLPTSTLAQLPREFIDGMVKRHQLLSDKGASALSCWDEVWREGALDEEKAIHILVILNAQMMDDGRPVPELEERTDWLRNHPKGIKLLTGHGRNNEDFQQGGARLVEDAQGRVIADATEHFGYMDGIGNPVFKGQYPKEIEARRVKGRGKIMPDQSWQPLATGEFLIGHVDESQELPYATQPPRFMYNGTFMAFRKIHQNVKTFDDYVREEAKSYAHCNQVDENVADVTIRAKIAGRWPNGAPLMVAPTYQDMLEFNEKWADIPAIRAKSGTRTREEQQRLDAYKQVLIDFKYRDDQEGVRCPVSSHIRRGNMRDMLDPHMNSRNKRDWTGSALTDRRRILRRGLPYGPFDPDENTDDCERGIIFIALCADIFRQFEFVVQQWINYGLDFNTGNDNCPLLGWHDESSKFIVQTDPESGVPPWILQKLPQFTETRGGEYFLVPSINTLNMIAMGTVDPT